MYKQVYKLLERREIHFCFGLLGTWYIIYVQPYDRRRQWHPTPVLLPGKSHGQRGLVGYSPQGCKELEMTKQLNNKTKYNGFHPMSSLHDISEDILQKNLKSQMG